MKTELRFLLAIVLMLGVLVGTNLLFPPVVPDEAMGPDSTAVVDTSGPAGPEGAAPEVPTQPGTGAPTIPGAEEAVLEPAQAEPAREITVEGPLYRYVFTDIGARLVSAEMLTFESFTREGVVDLIPEDAEGYLGTRFVVGSDTVDLRSVRFDVEPEGGLTLNEGSGPAVLTFSYQHPTAPFAVELDLTFDPEHYQVNVEGRVQGLERPLVLTDLGDGLAFAEADSLGEARAMAYVANHLQEGIRATPQNRPRVGLHEGPFLWAAFKSKFFVLAILPPNGTAEGQPPRYLGGMLVSESVLEERAHVAVAQSVGSDGSFGYRLFAGPQEYARLTSLGEDLEEVNPYGWKFFRPIVRPFVSVILTILVWMHGTLNLGYGWVLIIFGVAMRIVLFPLNHKAMKAQLRNMAVQPLVKEIQEKYKENPEKMQKEMMKLYKEHGFNPLAGCLPMLLPWPILIALFFVFQNTIELRGVSFLWLPDLSAPDPLYILPLFLGVSMFLMQWVSMRSLDQPNPTMKTMMWIMPVMMVFIFFRLASGLNLYYSVVNVATIPQQIWIARERKKMQAAGPPRANGD